ncbi:hypothetical protein [Bradyrhizobium sp. CCBAU 65884]|uniref:hypothetical protein n=1 Tax=Bradyrhizobium sp. CCBAU 65884 TaxID=722477 RepID=UPI002306917B|nr:hypothetical protein [Bradyrhizobium sp. CCBAU 65884]
MLRYVKDAALLTFGIYWPVRLSIGREGRNLRSFFQLYTLWLMLVLFLGTISYVFGDGFLPFLTAGLRWLLLLHASVGVGLMVFVLRSSAASQRLALLLLISVCLLDLIPLASQLLGAGLANVTVLRLPGMFSNAGTAGYFAIATSVVAYSAKKSGIAPRTMLMMLSLAIGAASGTRFAIIANLALMAALYLGAEKSLLRPTFRTYLGLGVVAPLLIVAAIALIGFTGRGDILEQQLSEGGRISNLQVVIDEIGRGDSVDILFGRGIGVGTNTAQGLADALHINATSVKWNILIDNTILTTFFQFGLFGSFVFWMGLFFLLRPLICRQATIILLVLALGLVTQNMFEQYFLMLAFAAGLAAVRQDAAGIAGEGRGHASRISTGGGRFFDRRSTLRSYPG